MRRKLVTYIFLGFIIWFLIIIQFNNILFRRDSSDTIDENPGSTVKIKYFAQFYKDSISIDPQNHNGELGKKVEDIPSENEERQKRFDLHKFNELASHKIPLLRLLPEKRRATCFNRQFDLDLPDASIIIIYHNEAFSTLARTVHTVLSRSPLFLIKEIILVDDNSDYNKFPHLLNPLDEHFKPHPVVKILRSEQRIGLTQARLLGSKSATGRVLVFLDSHCECFAGWLEPLLYDIKKNPRIAVTPIIEVIGMDDMAINPNVLSVVSVGSFTWKADFTWFVPKGQTDSPNIIKSPTMAGGLFAIDRNFFFEIGSYDDGMTYWGGENIEISFRLWTCADGIFTDPCSIVGHIFRKNSPHDLAPNSALFNKLRAVEVWMDDYKQYVYKRIGLSGYDIRAGSVEKRIKLRHDLKCKDFNWYLKEVASHIRVPGKPTTIKNPSTKKCIDAFNNHESGKPVNIYACHVPEGNQAMEVDSDGIIIFDDYCLDLSKGYPGARPTFFDCHFKGGNQKWVFEEAGLIKHEISNLCLQVDNQNNTLIATTCDRKDPLQQFEFTLSN